jgi:hypothetical protein
MRSISFEVLVALPMKAIIGRNMLRLNFITKNIVALDGIQS